MFKRTKKAGCSAVAIIAVGFLAACNNAKDIAGPPVLNGSWASSDGVYVAEFLNGQFRAVANDTGNVISEGSYIALAENRIQLNWVGKITGKSNQAECLKPEDNQLDCVDVNGNKFSLRRSL